MDGHLPHRNGSLRAAAAASRPERPAPAPEPATAGREAAERHILALVAYRRQLGWMAFWIIAWAAFLTWVIPDWGWGTSAACFVCGLLGGGLIGLRHGLGSSERLLRFLLRRHEQRGGGAQ